MYTVFWNYIGVTKGLEIERKKLTTAKHTIPHPWTTTAMKYTNMLNTRAKLLLLMLIKICKIFPACIKLLNHGRRNMDEHRLVCLGYQQCRFRLFHDIRTDSRFRRIFSIFFVFITRKCNTNSIAVPFNNSVNFL